MSGLVWLLLVWLLLQDLASGINHRENIPVEINTNQGRLLGYESIFLHRRVRSFLSVPFAEPPVGDLRFKPPRHKKPWNETRKANILSPACAQGRDTYNETFWGSEMWNANTPIQEDCLYMNIWLPAESAHNLTVMVWLFGGGFYSGSPSLILYDGKALALTANVIVVNLNYRVGPFGYLYLDDDDAPGNMGMLDQQMALHWIKENIHHFGGNPNAICLFGESAGASSIVAHLIAPGSQYIFNNGILQSGSLDNSWSVDTPERALNKSIQLAKLVGCAGPTTRHVLDCLKAKAFNDLVAQMWNLDLKFLEFPFVIVSRDRNFFREKDALIALHKKDYRQDVNLMIGINHDEGNYWNIYNLAKFFDVQEQPQLTVNEFQESVQTAFKSLPDVVRDAVTYAYLGDNRCEYQTGRHKFLAEQVNQMVGDYFFTCDSIWLADQLSMGPGNVYIYYFDQHSSANPWPSWTGVMHGYEIEYVFGVPIYNTTAGYTNRERILSQKMIQFWTSFAQTGVPTLRTNKETEEWPRYNPINNKRWMHLKGGSHIRPIPASKERECKLWRAERELSYHKYLIPLISKAIPSAVMSPMIVITSLLLAFVRL
ncbi:unnamed protein product [Bursaphelenchus okinawaensis]|uniref:Carboxylic ester hydrolase n=1 Tax=Bursaphelenchus okinawaensis TaxID=465554 RepID=A0A811K8R4_9BILA|nr:unnamed protein product [Bursaphelenchus okinawaensis]CAG9095167.1 unnamed protein product [Bursaphelenchus okinawaensis]